MSEIVTLAQLNTYLNKTIAGDSREDLIRLDINDLIDRYCNRVIGPATYTEKHSVMNEGRNTLVVRNPPIRTLTAIKSGRTSPTTLDSDAYAIESADAGVIKMVSSTLTVGIHQYEVDYAGGFATIPVSLRGVTLRIMGRAIQKIVNTRFGIRGRGFAQGNVEFDQTDFEPEERKILDLFRLTRMD